MYRADVHNAEGAIIKKTVIPMAIYGVTLKRWRWYCSCNPPFYRPKAA